MADQNLFQGNKIANLISLKLDDSNIKQWKQQISGVIRGLDLQKYITNPEIPAKFLTNEDLASGTVNPLWRWICGNIPTYDNLVFRELIRYCLDHRCYLFF